MSIFKVEIVNTEEEVFSGNARKLVATGELGELEILARHAPLITTLVPGPIWVEDDSGNEKAFVTFGGILEVQPDIATVLADSIVYAEDINKAAVEKAKKRAEAVFTRQGNAEDYAEAHLEIMIAAAQLRILKRLSKRMK